MAALDYLAGYVALAVHGGVGLGDDVVLLVDGGEIIDVTGDLALQHAAVGAFDKAELVDPGMGGQRVDQTDVGTLRGLDGTDTAIMGGMDVANLETGPLPGHAAGTQRRQTALVGDLRQGVGLIHELGELAGAEKFADDRRKRFGIHDVVGHQGLGLRRAHALANCPLHPHQTDANLIFQQLANRTHPAVAQMVDIVDPAVTILELEQHIDDAQDILFTQNPHLVVTLQTQTGVHLHPAHGGEVITVFIEEQIVEQVGCRLHRWRFAGTHHAIDVDQRLVGGLVFVDADGVRQVRADMNLVDEQNVDVGQPGIFKLQQQLLGDFGAGLGQYLTVLVNHVGRNNPTMKILAGNLNPLQVQGFELFDQAHGDLALWFYYLFSACRINQSIIQTVALKTVGVKFLLPDDPVFAIAL